MPFYFKGQALHILGDTSGAFIAILAASSFFVENTASLVLFFLQQLRTSSSCQPPFLARIEPRYLLLERSSLPLFRAKVISAGKRASSVSIFA